MGLRLIMGQETQTWWDFKVSCKENCCARNKGRIKLIFYTLGEKIKKGLEQDDELQPMAMGVLLGTPANAPNL